jgi:alpha-glucosidase
MIRKIRTPCIRVDEFLLGDHILVCPVLEPNAKSRYVYLPKGNWYHYWSYELLEGGKEMLADAALEEIPLYIREGAVLPFNPVMQYVGQKPVEMLTLKAYYGGSDIVSYLYEDSGDGYDYEKGIYNLKKFITNSTSDSFQMSFVETDILNPNTHITKWKCMVCLSYLREFWSMEKKLADRNFC